MATNANPMDSNSWDFDDDLLDDVDEEDEEGDETTGPRRPDDGGEGSEGEPRAVLTRSRTSGAGTTRTRLALTEESSFQRVRVNQHDGLDDRLGSDDDDDDDDDVNENESATTPRLLLGVYERYAALYPNPDLANEVAERERLLRAVRAAEEAEARMRGVENPHRAHTSASLPWWKRLLFRKGGDPTDRNEEKIPSVRGDDSRDGPLEYYSDSSDDEEEDDDEDDEDDGPTKPLGLRRRLLGTQWSLDASCIPDEAISLARFHLACSAKPQTSTSRRKGRPRRKTTTWNVARIGVRSSPTTESANTGDSTVIIVGMGRVLEYAHGHWTRSTTSDRDELVRYWGHHRRRQEREEDGSFREGWDARWARAAFVMPNLLAVAWGIPGGDSAVVLYERAEPPPHHPPEGAPRPEWEARAVLRPCEAVRAHAGGIFDGPEEIGGGVDHEGLVDNRLLTVTDLVPLPTDPSSIILAIGRLGGTIEVVSIPMSAVHSRGTRKPTSKRRSDKSQRPYSQNLVDLLALKEAVPPVVAFTTSEYHVDIMCLDVIAVPAPASTHTSISQFVVVATGRNSHDFRGEAVSFWRVTVTTPADSRGPPGAHLDATILTAIDVGELGPDASVFASPTLYQYWRRPRRVRLRHGRDGSAGDGPISARDGTQESGERVTTVSTPSPAISIRSHASHSQFFVSVLDYHGGVHVIDGSEILRNLSSRQPFESLHRQPLPELATILVDRSRVLRCIACGLHPKDRLRNAAPTPFAVTSQPTVSDACWYSAGTSPDSAGHSPQLALFLSQTRSVMTLPIACEFDEEHHLPVSSVSLPSQCSIVSLRGNQDGTLSLFSFSDSSIEGVDDVYSAFVLSELGPRALVESLVQQAKYREAINTANELSSATQETIRDLIETSKLKEWRRLLDLHLLESIQDVHVVVAEVLALDASRVESAVGASNAMQHFRNCLGVALERSAASGADSDSATLRQTLIGLGTYELLCQNFSVEPSFQTYCDGFAQSRLEDLASSLAQRLDFAGLSILRFRHWNEFDASFKSILNNLPVSVDPLLYLHLLPTTSHGKFVRCEGTDLVLCEQDDFEAVARQQCSAIVAMDDIDRRLILDSCDVQHIAERSIEEWYMHRFQQIADSTRSITYTRTFASCALVAMSERQQSKVSLESTTFIDDYWRSIIRRSNALLYLRGEGPSDEESDEYAPIYDIEVDGVTNVPALVRTVIRYLRNPEQSHELYIQVLAPYIVNGEVNDDIDLVLSDCCLKMLRDVNGDCRTAVRRSSLVCHLSRTSLAARDRWIKSSSVLAEVAQASFEAAIGAFPSTPPGSIGSLLADCWTIYESLPVNDERAGHENIDFIADRIFEHLVVFEVMAQWPGASIVPVQLDGELQAQEIFKSISKAFVVRFSVFRGIDFDSRAKGLLSMLASNVMTLKRLRRFDSVDIDLIASTATMKALIESSKLEALNLMLSTSGYEWLNLSVVRESLISFLDESEANKKVFDFEGGQLTSVASSCFDILGRFFPDTALRVKESQHYLKGLDYLQNVLLQRRRSRLNSSSVRQSPPLDVVYMVLSDHPELVTFGCEQWNNPHHSESENMSRRRATSSAAKNQPELARAVVWPGDAILHLAVLLGLGNEPDRLAVSCLIASQCLVKQLFGAAAYVCLQSISSAGVWKDNGSSTEALRMASRILSKDEYQDFETKAEICICCLRGVSKLRKLSQVPSLERLVQTCVTSEWRRSLFMNRIQHRLFMVNRLCIDTETAYHGTNLVMMLQNLQTQAAVASVDGSLIVALSKLEFYWCISQFTRKKSRAWTDIEERFAQAIASMASSYLLHTPESHSSLLALDEVRSILIEQERANAPLTTPGAPYDGGRAGAEIVRRLKDRGYSELGSRRALVMSGSHSFDDALQWAVLHCLDDDFDKPIIHLLSDTVLVNETKCIAYLKDVIGATEALVASSPVEDSRRERMMPFIGNEQVLEANRMNSTFVPALHGPGQSRSDNRTSARDAKSGDRQDMSSVAVRGVLPDSMNPPGDSPPLESTALPNNRKSGSQNGRHVTTTPSVSAGQESALPGVSAVAETIAIHTSEEAHRIQSTDKSNNRSSLTIDDPPVTERSRERVSSTASRVVAPQIDVSKVHRTVQGNAYTKVGLATENSKVPALSFTRPSLQATVSGIPPPTRSSLRLHGQATLSVARSHGSPASEERRRLIAAGRQLLKSAATRRTSGIPTPTATMTKTTQSRGDCVSPAATPCRDHEITEGVTQHIGERGLPTGVRPSKLDSVKTVNGSPAHDPNGSSSDALDAGWGFDEPSTESRLDPGSEDRSKSNVKPTSAGVAEVDHNGSEAASDAPGISSTSDWDFDDLDVDLT